MHELPVTLKSSETIIQNIFIPNRISTFSGDDFCASLLMIMLNDSGLF